MHASHRICPPYELVALQVIREAVFKSHSFNAKIRLRILLVLVASVISPSTKRTCANGISAELAPVRLFRQLRWAGWPEGELGVISARVEAARLTDRSWNEDGEIRVERPHKSTSTFCTAGSVHGQFAHLVLHNGASAKFEYTWMCNCCQDIQSPRNLWAYLCTNSCMPCCWQLRVMQRPWMLP
jgi:hypothetical protein